MTTFAPLKRMRVVQLRRGRVIKLSLLALVSVAGVFLLYKHYNGDDLKKELLSHINKAGLAGHRNVGGDDHARSFPDDVPVFLGSSSKGNFEPEVYGGGSGPGDNGKPHQLRIEQKNEEETLKGVYGFNQLVSDEISLNRTVPGMEIDDKTA